MEVFVWMSNVLYRGHHRSKKKDYLAGSCKWLLEKEEFIEWGKSSVSSILWLRGIRELCPTTHSQDIADILRSWFG